MANATPRRRPGNEGSSAPAGRAPAERRPKITRLDWLVALLLLGGAPFGFAQAPDVRVGATAVNLRCDRSMVLAGFLEGRYTNDQEGELRAVAVVVEKPGQAKLAIVACDVLWIPRSLADQAVAEIERTTGIPGSHILINATHTHHAPSTAPSHGFGVSVTFCDELRRAIVKAVQTADAKLAEGACTFYFHLGEEKTVGANSRLQLPDGNITWLNPLREAAGNVRPTGPFDPQLPVLDFRDAQGRTQALIYNHSTHTIGTRAGTDVRSPGFYGLAAQELETELGGVVSFLEGASGSTHNIAQVPVAEAVKRLKQAVRDARAKATPHPVTQLAALRRAVKFPVRVFNDGEEDQKILRYSSRYAPQATARIREIFANMRRQLQPQQGAARETWVQAMRIGDVALVGVPAEYFTVLGMDIKKRSPFRYTYVAELANDWIGYLPDRPGHRLGGYQTWMGLHSYAEVGTGERIADEAVQMLEELAGKAPARASEQSSPAAAKPTAAAPSPRTPLAEQRSFHLADPSLEIELVAAEPQVVSPVALSWDADGRLYVAEMIGYPTTEKQCRVRRLEDTKGSGHYDRATVFADGLSFVNCVMPYRGGVLVTAAPDILWFKDTNGDGRADGRQVLWTGFGLGSQQLRANALHWGLDNWIYGASGRNDANVRLAKLRLPQDGFEATGLRHVVLEQSDVAAVPSLAAQAIVDPADPADSGRVYPISPPPRQFNTEQSLYYNAMCGLTIFRGDGLGTAYAGDAFVCESLTNLVTRRKLVPRGPTFRTVRTEIEQEFLASTDSWFHPVFLATGPDGCLYVVDFYREFVEHPIYVADATARATVNWRNGAEHGRIWRIRKKDAPNRAALPHLEQSPAAALVALLGHPVGWWRDTAQRLLVQRQDPSVVPSLEAMVATDPRRLARLHALWSLQGLGALKEPILVAALRDPEPRLRRQALYLAAERLNDRLVRDSILTLTGDPDPAVRFQLALALKGVNDVAATGALRALLQSAEDEWLARAVLCGAAERPAALAAALLEDASWRATPQPAQAEFLRQLGMQLGSRRDWRTAQAVLARVAPSASKGIPPGQLALIAGLVQGLEAAGTSLRALAGLSVDSAELAPTLAKAVLRLAREPVAPTTTRVEAIAVLVGLQPPGAAEALLQLLPAAEDAGVASAAARGISTLADPKTCAAVYAHWKELGRATRLAVLTAAPRSSVASEALLTALEQGTVLLTELPADVRESLCRAPASALAERARRRLPATTAADRQRIVQTYVPALALAGNLSHGAALFKEHCQSCHAIRGVGQRVGPDLSSVGARRNDILLVDLLDPSRQVTPDFLAYTIVTKAGAVVTGLIKAETATSITLRRVGGEEETIPRSAIEELRASGKSFMPDGFEQKLKLQDVADLLEFLRRPEPALLAKP